MGTLLEGYRTGRWHPTWALVGVLAAPLPIHSLLMCLGEQWKRAPNPRETLRKLLALDGHSSVGIQGMNQQMEGSNSAFQMKNKYYKTKQKNIPAVPCSPPRVWPSGTGKPAGSTQCSPPPAIAHTVRESAQGLPPQDLGSGSAGPAHGPGSSGHRAPGLLVLQ